MTLLETAKKVAEKLTGVGRPAKEDLAGLVRLRKPRVYHFRDDGFTPNHPKWGLVLYRNAVKFPRNLDPAAILEDLIESNGWGDSWRNGIYGYLHYHSRIHEVLAVARGSAKVRFGGAKGRTLQIKRGDVAVIPAGTGHQCLGASDDFLVVGAYPPAGTYDECRATKAEHEAARKRIRKVRPPRKDPLYGKDGPLVRAWR